MPQQEPESPHAAWLPEAHRTAQTSAMVWAQRADEAYEQAQRYEDRAQSWTPNAAHAEVIANERATAREHAARYSDARRRDVGARRCRPRATARASGADHGRAEVDRCLS